MDVRFARVELRYVAGLQDALCSHRVLSAADPHQLPAHVEMAAVLLLNVEKS